LQKPFNLLETTNMESFDVISTYSRAQAIDDGVLIDLMQDDQTAKLCREHFKCPIACTAALWELIQQAISHPKHSNDLLGVLHDILWMSKRNKKAVSGDGNTWLFEVIITGTGKKDVHTLKLVLGQGDDEEPVLTLKVSGED
jgi:hypothetical protein